METKRFAIVGTYARQAAAGRALERAYGSNDVGSCQQGCRHMPAIVQF